jgi:hypothetical protein
MLSSKLTHLQAIKKAHCRPSRRDDAKVAVRLTLRFLSQAAPLATKHTPPTLRQHRISPGAHINGTIRINMTTLHPFLKAVSLIHQAVRILAPAATVTRILEVTTLRKQRNLRMLEMSKSTIIGNVPGILPEATMLRNLRMLEMSKSTIIGNVPGILLEATMLRNLRMLEMSKSTIIGNVLGILLEATMLRNLRMLEMSKSTIIGYITGTLL